MKMCKNNFYGFCAQCLYSVLMTVLPSFLCWEKVALKINICSKGTIRIKVGSLVNKAFSSQGDSVWETFAFFWFYSDDKTSFNVKKLNELARKGYLYTIYNIGHISNLWITYLAILKKLSRNW